MSAQRSLAQAARGTRDPQRAFALPGAWPRPTNPPAVIGLDRQSLIAGCAAPVAPPDCFLSGFDGCWDCWPVARIAKHAIEQHRIVLRQAECFFFIARWQLPLRLHGTGIIG